MAKRLIRLTEGDLHRIIRESVRRIIREDEITGEPGEDEVHDMYHDTTTGVYCCCRREYAQKIVDIINSGEAYKLVAKGNACGDGIYATLRPKMDSIYGDTIIQLLVPSSAVKPQFSRRDGDFCVLDPNDIYSASIYR